jgi:EAL domain-containing protein (putative c-di-GMP-specific phosphodiesterase class I)
MPEAGHVLVIEDEPALLEIYASILADAGYTVDQAESVEASQHWLATGSLDLVISDIRLRDGTGIDVLRAVRQRSMDLPVILVTGDPAVDSAVQAIELGVMRYLVKPVPSEDLLRATEQAVRLHRLAEIKREALAYLGAEAAFARGLASLWMAFQPIVHAVSGQVFGHEALLRTDEASLPGPGAFIQAAVRLQRTTELGRAIRSAVARARFAGGLPTLFVNLLARDLEDEDLYDPGAPLSSQGRRVVLEITERESIESAVGVRDRIARLRGLGYRIALDDLGSGYAGLNSFALLEPDIVKLDLGLVRSVDRDPTKRRLIASLAGLCREMRILIVAEGIETESERATLRDLGCDLLQGFLIGRPVRPE